LSISYLLLVPKLQLGNQKKDNGSILLRVSAIRKGYFVQGGIGGKGDAHTGTPFFRVPEIAALPHAGADVGEGAEGGGVSVHYP